MHMAFRLTSGQVLTERRWHTVLSVSAGLPLDPTPPPSVLAVLAVPSSVVLMAQRSPTVRPASAGLLLGPTPRWVVRGVYAAPPSAGRMAMSSRTAVRSRETGRPPICG